MTLLKNKNIIWRKNIGLNNNKKKDTGLFNFCLPDFFTKLMNPSGAHSSDQVLSADTSRKQAVAKLI